MIAIIIVLVVNYGTPSGESRMIQERMESLEECEKTAAELLRAVDHEILKYGILTGCRVRFVGQPA
jgi:hypothetical protein